VRGVLHVSNAPALTSLAGLEALTSVGGNVYVGLTPALASVAALSSLTSVGGVLAVIHHASLPTCLATALRDQLTHLGEGACIELNLADSCPDDTSGC